MVRPIFAVLPVTLGMQLSHTAHTSHLAENPAACSKRPPKPLVLRDGATSRRSRDSGSAAAAMAHFSPLDPTAPADRRSLQAIALAASDAVVRAALHSAAAPDAAAGSSFQVRPATAPHPALADNLV